MTENVENLVLEYLRRIDRKADMLTEDVRDVKLWVSSGEGHLATVQGHLATLQGDVARIDTRLDRVDMRLDLVEV